MCNMIALCLHTNSYVALLPEKLKKNNISNWMKCAFFCSFRNQFFFIFDRSSKDNSLTHFTNLRVELIAVAFCYLYKRLLAAMHFTWLTYTSSIWKKLMHNLTSSFFFSFIKHPFGIWFVVWFVESVSVAKIYPK